MLSGVLRPSRLAAVWAGLTTLLGPGDQEASTAFQEACNAVLDHLHALHRGGLEEARLAVLRWGLLCGPQPPSLLELP